MRSSLGACLQAPLLALAAALFLTPIASPAAAYTMCAFRSGPNGPCTCKGETDAAGQFTTVAKSYCRKTPDPAKAAGPASAAKPDDTPKTEAAAEKAPQPAPAKDAASDPPASPAPAPATAPASPAAQPAPAIPQTAPATSPAPGKLAEIRGRGWLNCGVSTGILGFSSQTESGQWTGFDADFCRAVAAAALGDASKVEFVPLDTTGRFEALKSGKIDVLSRNTTITLARDTDLELEFAGILYFDGQSFMTSDDRGFVSAQQLSGLKVCVEAGTTSETNMTYYFQSLKLEVEAVSFKTREELLKSYLDGTCDAYSGDRSGLYSDRAGFPEPLKHTVLPEVISKEPLGPAVLQGDQHWAEIVRWTLAGLINAEEVGLDKAKAASPDALKGDALRLAEGAAASSASMKLSKTWLRDAVSAAGNYGEMFEANIGKSSPLGMERGLNALWKKGGILYAPPMW